MGWAASRTTRPSEETRCLFLAVERPVADTSIDDEADRRATREPFAHQVTVGRRCRDEDVADEATRFVEGSVEDLVRWQHERTCRAGTGDDTIGAPVVGENRASWRFAQEFPQFRLTLVDRSGLSRRYDL